MDAAEVRRDHTVSIHSKSSKNVRLLPRIRAKDLVSCKMAGYGAIIDAS